MNTKKQNKNRTKNQKHDKKYREKSIKHEWTCQICQSLNDNASFYCVNCLQTLYYYNYVNGYLFVQKD